MQSEPQITLYGHSTCPQLPPVLLLLNQNRIEYAYINIHKDDDARERVRAINNGYESVPTLEFSDGTTLTEPRLSDLRKKLESLGYEVKISPAAWLADRWFIIFVGGMLLLAVLRGLNVF